MYKLLTQTPEAWLNCVLNDFDRFLIDHAACERKASGMAMSLVAHYPDKPDLVKQMIDLAIEELNHFREVMKWIQQRDLVMTPDEKDPYVNQLRQQMRKGREDYMLDRLIVASLVEARGHERFGLVAHALPEGGLKTFYRAITQSEERHYIQFLTLSERYFPKEKVDQRLEALLPIEADIVTNLPIRSALH